MLASSNFDRRLSDCEVEMKKSDVQEKSIEKEKDKGKGIDESEKHNVTLLSQKEGSRMQLGMKIKLCGLFEEGSSQIPGGCMVIEAEEPREPPERQRDVIVELPQRPFGLNLLFELELNWSNRLIIPEKLAADFFPALPPLDGTVKEELLLLTIDGQIWKTKLIYYEDEAAFMVLRGWPNIVNHYSLKPQDLIGFYTPPARLHKNHFQIEYHKEPDWWSLDVPEFKPENFLFALRLTHQDVGYYRLVIPGHVVRTYFPAVRIPEPELPALKHEILRFTDARGKDWYMILVFAGDKDAYMIIDGWESFVRERRLGAMDVIKFYKLDHPSHSKHFLVDYGKRGKGVRIDPADPQADGSHGSNGAKRPKLKFRCSGR